MERTLKITNVFSDPTRFNIYQFLLERQDKSVTVLEVAEKFSIHPNVARIHLTKLEEINVVKSDFERTGKGGRPSKLYEISDEVIELNFPHRDYKLLSEVAIDTLVQLGAVGKSALYEMGKKYGKQYMEKALSHRNQPQMMTINEKINLLKNSSGMLGMYPDFHYDEEQQQILFQIKNCPFKEVAKDHRETVCKMHYEFIKGMFNVLFDDIDLIERNNMFASCTSCKYVAQLAAVK